MSIYKNELVSSAALFDVNWSFGLLVLNGDGSSGRYCVSVWQAYQHRLLHFARLIALSLVASADVVVEELPFPTVLKRMCSKSSSCLTANNTVPDLQFALSFQNKAAIIEVIFIFANKMWSCHVQSSKVDKVMTVENILFTINSNQWILDFMRFKNLITLF